MRKTVHALVATVAILGISGGASAGVLSGDAVDINVLHGISDSYPGVSCQEYDVSGAVIGAGCEIGAAAELLLISTLTRKLSHSTTQTTERVITGGHLFQSLASTSLTSLAYR